MLPRLILLLSTLICAIASSAQQKGVDFIERKAAFKMALTFDFRRTWVNEQPVGFYGLRLGAQKNKNIISLGFYGLSSSFIEPEVDLGEPLGDRELRTKFDFTTLTYERIIFENEKWQLGIPFGVGLGNYRTQYRNDDGSFRAYSANELVPVDLSIYANYNVKWWAFVGFGGGYRYVYARDGHITDILSNWTWFAKAGLRFGKIYQRILGTEDDH
jgi:hypothetical protein